MWCFTRNKIKASNHDHVTERILLAQGIFVQGNKSFLFNPPQYSQNDVDTQKVRDTSHGALNCARHGTE